MGTLEFIRPVKNDIVVSSPYSLRIDPLKKDSIKRSMSR